MKQTSAAFDNFKHDNPLMVRKKFQMKDVYFRRDMPEQEVFRWEVAFDTELYVLVLAAGIVAALAVGKLCCSMSHRKKRRHESCSHQIHTL